MKWWAWLLIGLVIIAIVIVLAVVGSCFLCVRVAEEVGETIGETIEEVTEQHEITILEHSPIFHAWGDGDTQVPRLSKYGTPVITGRAKNNYDFTLTMLRVDVRWYAADQTLLDEDSDYLGADLRPAEIWEFEINGYGIDYERVDNYEISGYGYRSYSED